MPVEVFDTPAQLAEDCAGRIVAAAAQRHTRRERFCLALAGGSTPRLLYSLLATEAYRTRVAWSNVDLFWGDERCVPPDHADSNYRMVEDALLTHLPLEDHPGVYRMLGELPPQQAAEDYETRLRRYLQEQGKTSFDLVLLGMGEDGHTASLFPGTAAVHETQRLAVAHFVEKLSAWRLTLTPAILNLAGQVIFLVSGESKSSALAQVLYGPRQPERLPAQVIQPRSGDPLWLVDCPAAGS